MVTKATPDVVLTGSRKLHSLGSVSGAVAIDFSLGLAVELSLSGDATFTFSNWPSGWETAARLYITSNGHTVTWPATVTWSPATVPTLTGAGAIDVIEVSTLDGDPVFAKAVGTAVPASPTSLPTGGATAQVLEKNSATNYDASWKGQQEIIHIAMSDETTALTAGTGKGSFRLPFPMTLTAVRASLVTAQASGSIFTVDMNEAGVSVLSTKLTIDNTELTSTTAATPAVISDANLADDALISFDIDQIGNGTAAGLKVVLIGRRA